ncbi:TPA: lytic transglycosylase domain-containing protein [Klebsiella oxytoca]|uniref:Lytic transglycosylase domain-containing protein n=1 Tax=Klebsiella oxytoca TaxID=571 RepID=A0AAN5LCB1_KLEOX|nr:lytic transglycosylase domain-containing protein [Klebsiella oxytoca]
MENRGILTLCLLSVLALSGVAISAPRQPVPAGYRQVALAHGVPPASLYAVALTESSRQLPRGVRPWPWTINVAGKGYRYATRLEAWSALQQFMTRHPLKRIDVGVAQVNLGWNGSRFRSTWEAFDPYINLNVAATVLRECRESTGDWLAAAGCYHHPAGGKPAARYRAIVRRHLAGLSVTPPAASPVMAVADARFIWVEPEQHR